MTRSRAPVDPDRPPQVPAQSLKTVALAHNRSMDSGASMPRIQCRRRYSKDGFALDPLRGEARIPDRPSAIADSIPASAPTTSSSTKATNRLDGPLRAALDPPPLSCRTRLNRTDRASCLMAATRRGPTGSMRLFDPSAAEQSGPRPAPATRPHPEMTAEYVCRSHEPFAPAAARPSRVDIAPRRLEAIDDRSPIEAAISQRRPSRSSQARSMLLRLSARASAVAPSPSRLTADRADRLAPTSPSACAPGFVAATHPRQRNRAGHS